MSRRISISTVMNFFREASTDEVRAVMPLVFEALGKRKIAVDGAATQRRTRRLNGHDMEINRTTEQAEAPGV